MECSTCDGAGAPRDSPEVERVLPPLALRRERLLQLLCPLCSQVLEGLRVEAEAFEEVGRDLQLPRSSLDNLFAFESLIYIYLYIYISISIYLSICLSIYLSIYLSI